MTESRLLEKSRFCECGRRQPQEAPTLTVPDEIGGVPELVIFERNRLTRSSIPGDPLQRGMP
jgi:hypothetical protein